MKVIIDWVPNHTGADHRWLTEQPDFFVKDSTGKAAMAVDWADTRQLNYKNPVMQDSMIAAMKYWVSKTDINGFRCVLPATTMKTAGITQTKELFPVRCMSPLQYLHKQWPTQFP